MEKTHSFKVSTIDASKRLDVYLSEKSLDISRSAIKRLVKDGLVLIDDKPAKPSHRVKSGELLTVTIPTIVEILKPEPIPLKILYEDDDVIVVNKQQGLTVHPGAGTTHARAPGGTHAVHGSGGSGFPAGTLVNALLNHTDALSTVGGPLRRGIVHRLDKDTSGVMVIAKNDSSHANLSLQFQRHSTKRTYHALVWGEMQREGGKITLPIGRDISDRKKFSPRAKKKRHAVTNFKVLKRYPYFTLLEITPQTGRTHQIRVHLKSMNHPIAGDPVYGKKTPPLKLPPQILDYIKKLRGQLLHAKTLGFNHPAKGNYMEFSAEYPDIFAGIIKILNSSKDQTACL